uniref:PID domain-containing protein n=1 Tax=Latimeria chalumnae TaxID=7897 RepID=H3BIL4_LATCH
LTHLLMYCTYSAKLLGHVCVDHPRGIQVLTEALEKIQFLSAGKKKLKKNADLVEMQISPEEVKVLSSKTKLLLHSCPLHSISFCAVHETFVKVFGYVCRNIETRTHQCFLFQSQKLAHSVILMIGEAFKVAHTSNDKPRKNSGERSLALTDLQKMNQELKAENDSLRKKVVELEWRLQEKSVVSTTA